MKNNTRQQRDTRDHALALSEADLTDTRTFLLTVMFACEDLSAAYSDAGRSICAALATGDAATFARRWPHVQRLLAPWLERQ